MRKKIRQPAIVCTFVWDYTQSVEYQMKERCISNIFITAFNSWECFLTERSTCQMAKISEEEQIHWSMCLVPPPPHTISVSIGSYISMLDLPSLHFADCFLFAKAGQPQLTNQNAGNAQRETGILRKQTSTVNQKWFQRMITDGANEECSYKLCASPVIHMFPKLLSILLQNSL